MRVLNPPKLVLVHRDDRRCDGELHGWRRDPEGWVGYVRYAVSPGLRHWSGSTLSGCAVTSSDHAEQIAIGVSQNNEVGIVGILPVDPLSAQGDQTLDLDLLIGLVVSPEVEVRPIFIIEV
jgi:hypothetical protein